MAHTRITTIQSLRKHLFLCGGAKNQFRVIAAQNFSTESDNSSNTNHHEEETVTEDELKHNILDSALHFVPTHGWSVTAIAEGSKHYGYPGVAHGLFPRGGGDLMHHFVRQCNSEISKHLKSVTNDTEVSNEKNTLSQSVMKDALEMRLRMLIPYLEHWPQAMALTALPANIQEHFQNLYKLIDDVCFYAGDRSVDFNWYTKRLSLAAAYKSCELHMIQDESHDYQETWEFLDRRLDDFTMAGRIKEDIDRFVNPEFFSSVYNVVESLHYMVSHHCFHTRSVLTQNPSNLETWKHGHMERSFLKYGRNILGVNDQRR